MEIFAEFLSFISSCNIFVKFKDCIVIKNIEISRRDFSIILSNQNSIKFLLPSGITFKPEVLNNVNFENGWFSFRVFVEDRSRIINTVLSELSIEISNLKVTQSLEQSLPKQNVKVLCIECGHPVSGEICFGRVLPLPSVDWDAASEGWFCHLHSGHKKLLKESSLIPKADDCFYNEMSFCFSKNIIEMGCGRGVNVSCTKCKREIGVVSGSKVKIWSSDVKLMGKNTIFHFKSPKDIVINLIKNLEKDSFGINPRIVLQCVSNECFDVLKGCTYLCLHPIDTSIELLVSNTDNEIDQLKKKTKFNERYLIESLQKIKAVKILYKFKASDDEESGRWIDDINFHIVPCGKYFFENVLDLLNKSNEELPFLLKTAGDLNIGYILK